MPEETTPTGPAEADEPSDHGTRLLVHATQIRALEEGQSAIRADIRLVLDRLAPAADQKLSHRCLSAIERVFLGTVEHGAPAAKDIAKLGVDGMRTWTGAILAVGLVAAVTVGGTQVIDLSLEGLQIRPAALAESMDANRAQVAKDADGEAVRDSLPDAGP